MQVLPKEAKPISNWDRKDTAWQNVCDEIRKLLKSYTVIPSPKTINELERIDFVSSEKESLSLSQLFVWPSASTINQKGNSTTINLSFDEIIRNKKSLISGPQLSGKTSLLRMIYLEALKKDYVPVLVNGTDIQRKTRQFMEVIEKEAKYQYDCFNLDDYNRNILLIDDYNHFISDSFLSYAESAFSFIIVSCSEEEKLMFLNTAKEFSNYSTYEIEPFYPKRRIELIYRWKGIKSKSDMDENTQLSIDNLNSEVNEIIGKQIVPSYPFHVLSILQARETMPSKFSFSAFGHCYYVLVLAILEKKGIPRNEFDSSINFLSCFAHNVFLTGRINNWTVDEGEYNSFKEEYSKSFYIEERVVNYLEDQLFRIIRIDKGFVRFEHKYLFYYFAGKWFADNYNEKDISFLCERIFIKDYSEILVFIIHHSNNNEVINEIEFQCMCSYEKKPPILLTKEETAFMNELMNSLPKQIESKLSVEETRDEIINASDAGEREAVKKEENLEDYNNEVYRDLAVGFRLLDVVGQIIKTRSGSIKKDTVKELLFEVEQLGLRILNFCFEVIKSKDFSDWVMDRILQNPSINKKDTLGREKIARRYIAAFCNLNILLMLSRIAGAVSSKKLLETQRILATENNGSAFELLYLIQYLTYNGIENPSYIFELKEKYKKDNDIWSETVLGLLVQAYFHSHHVSNVILKQRICSVFEWDIKKLK